MAFSILIKNGRIIDGTGKAPFLADIGISANRIERIGDLQNETADQVIDAANLYVTPGFIDLTNHADVYGTLFTVPSQESLLKQGVTTILVGNCGESLAPVIKKESLNNLERWTTGFSVPINWTGVAEYYDNIEALGSGVNVATLVGHDTLKRNADTPAERAFLLENALLEGAWGMSSNFSFAARTSDEEEEIKTLLGAVKKYDGLYKIHLRDEGRNFLPSLSSAITLARESGARTVISHLKAVGRGAWNDFPAALKMLQEAKKDGVDISFDFFPYFRTGSMLASFLPSWARAQKNDVTLQYLSDKKTRAQIMAEIKNATLHPERILFASAARDKGIVGQTLAELSRRAALPPEEVILDILEINNLNVSIFGKTISARNLLMASAEPGGIVTSNGAGYDTAFQRFGDLAHPRSFGAFPRFFRAISQSAKISLGEAVAKMTSLPAKALGLRDRGILKPKNIADIAVFHPEEFRDSATYKNPYRYAAGLRHLLLSGESAILNGETSARRNGLILRKKSR